MKGAKNVIFSYRVIYDIFGLMRTWPHLIWFAAHRKFRELVWSDICAAGRCLYKSKVLNLSALLLRDKNFRNVFYMRMQEGVPKRVLRRILHENSNMQLACENVGLSFKVYHGNSTIVWAEKIGNNFSIWQNVTIGRKDFNGKVRDIPRIGDNVKICTGAIVLGDISVGSNVVIAAGAVVTKDVPDNVVVAGVPAKVVKKLE